LQGVDAVFSKKKGARILIWVTDADSTLPVKLKSKAPVGSFVAELVAIQGPEEMLTGTMFQ